MQRCADCRHVEPPGEDDDKSAYRCGCRVPFWVPLPVHDYGSWVKPDDGTKCNAFEKRN